MTETSRRSPRGQTQRITPTDIASGRIRIPISDQTKRILPSDAGEVRVVLKGVDLGTRHYDPRLGPDRERSGVISIDPETLAELVRENERLSVTRNRSGTIYIGDRGSKLRIAQWVNERPLPLGEACLDVSRTLRDFAEKRLPDWRSPLAAEDHVELSSDLWDRLELEPPTPSEDGFWPRRQPQWDAVAALTGRRGERGLLLVEAKSHTSEVVSKRSARSAQSKSTIDRALSDTQAYLGVRSDVDWTEPHYQAANRLAFLYYLRARRNIPAWLFNVYFLGDSFEVDGIAQPCPVDGAGWEPTLDAMHRGLGLPSCHPLTHFSHDLFLPVL